MNRTKRTFLLILLLASQGLAAPETKNEVEIRGGSFRIPVVLNQKELKVSSFFLDTAPVSNKDYLEFVKKNPEWRKSKTPRIFADKDYLQYWKSDQDFGGEAFAKSPVVRVSWYAARAYCESLGKRLPGMEEWEYAAQLPFDGDRDMKSLILEWYGSGAVWPLPAVRSGPANKAGVHDMHGLIWEWVEDFNTFLVTGESRADSSLDKNLFCGAGAMGAADPADYAAFMRFAFRGSLKAAYTVQNLGFRCARTKE